jgi:hypothetical protein
MEQDNSSRSYVVGEDGLLLGEIDFLDLEDILPSDTHDYASKREKFGFQHEAN